MDLVAILHVNLVNAGRDPEEDAGGSGRLATVVLALELILDAGRAADRGGAGCVAERA
ncbi:hypothetical protein V7S43_017211 [Phytophthora oleae]|uniref:Uncharacterized protein n=1 Tax=Phytophthora oleae TaxID=2107226 RepID=A0ABD3EVV4_9STRA